MGKRSREKGEDYIIKKIRKLEKKLEEERKSREDSTRSVQPEPQQDELPQPLPPAQTTTAALGAPGTLENHNLDTNVTQHDLDIDENAIPEEYLQALGKEGEEIIEVGEAINPELSLRWTRLMNEGLGKEGKETIVKKYPTPSNFARAIAPEMNPEILASVSELTVKRDKRIVVRQNTIGKLMTCLGRSLTGLLKGDFNSKSLIEQTNDAAKLAAEIYFQDSSSRRFFALSGSNQTVKEAVKDSKPDKFLLGKDCAEKVRAAQAIKKSSYQMSYQMKSSETTSAKAPSKMPPVAKKQGNWRGPPQQQFHQRVRGGHHAQPPRRQNNSNYQHQRRQQYQRSKPSYRR